ncbi:lysine-rich nucleolar protein 1 [Orycteropus afer afer]|uniref:Lysine-rich nucleolar protein 1 n=1 Tax=Orycteropus afer afer TaxID=1230840 RepID=A0A8B7AZ80_ORYAF|nr:lysine-rich nucleolar protein 1 [Orycteropus afer afer]
MITKTQQVDVGLGLPEKKKKKKKVVKESEIHSSVLKHDYSTEVSPRRAICSTKNVIQAPEMPLVKKKKKKKKEKVLCEDHLEPETVLRARQREKSPSSRKQALGLTEFHSREKKKKRRSLSALSVSHGLEVDTSLNPRQGEEGTRVGSKLKKHKKEQVVQDTEAFSGQSPWLCEAGDALCACRVGKGSEKLAALGQKRKQGSPREHQVKMKKKKKLYQEGDLPLDHHKVSRSTGSSPRKGSKKKPVKLQVLECIPVGDGPKTLVKKKTKSKKQAEQPGIEESALKKKKKKRKGSGVSEEPGEEEPDPDLEVVLEKKGNVDEAHIDQVRRKALQEEIDRESGKTEASETKKWTGTQFGQWDTADFENEDQKRKFLKLMGGFKNLPPSFSHPPGMIGRPNMALSKKAADALQQSLQQDYDRAMSWQNTRGAGLGFSKSPDKVFYIDRSASKSIKFED